MQLLQSWQESLALFKPKNLKIFGLVTLKSIGRALKELAVPFWWLVTGYIAFTVLMNRYWLTLRILVGPLLTEIGIPLIGVLLFLTLLFAMFLVIRPSVLPKNWNYFKRYGLHYLWFIVVSILWYIFSFLLLASVVGIYHASFISELVKELLSWFVTTPFLTSIVVLLACIWAVFVLFFLDSDGSFKQALFSLLRSFKMIIYNYPFFFIIQLLCLPLSYGLMGSLLYKSRVLGNIVSTLFLLFFLLIVICIITNFYVKRLHEQFGVYFLVKKKE